MVLFDASYPLMNPDPKAGWSVEDARQFLGSQILLPHRLPLLDIIWNPPYKLKVIGGFPVNQWFKKSTLLLAALTSPLTANLDDDVWGSETLFTDNGAHGPFVLNGSADFIQKARITTRPFRRDKVEFGEADADLS